MMIKKSKWEWGFKWQHNSIVIMFGKLKKNRQYHNNVLKYSGCNYIHSSVKIGIIREYYIKCKSRHY